jgi:anti-sigma factor RsiW
MTCQAFEQELGDFVDGTLAPDRTAVIGAHVRGCDACRAMVEDFMTLRSVARTLEPELPPPHVWTRLAAALEQEHERRPWWRLSSGALAWRPVVAAAVMVVLLGGASWLAWRETATPVSQTAGNAIPSATATQGSGIPTPIDAVQAAEQTYTKEIGDLEQVTKAQSGALDPRTQQVVQANLEVIDQAIGQSREALKTQPANAVAQDSLFDALRSKVQLLQDTVALINEMRKGNQDGAARIMSEMNQ